MTPKTDTPDLIFSAVRLSAITEPVPPTDTLHSALITIVLVAAIYKSSCFYKRRNV